jgi:hypothetical protein
VFLMAALVSVSARGLAGDTVIHLVFAEHALAGHWFEFNRGVSSGGESSPLYMLYVTGLYALVGPRGVPYALQAMGIAAWAALLTGMWKLMRLLGAEHGWALALVGLVGLMPGSARNAVMGMENAYFAAGVLWWLVSVVHRRWFERLLPWRLELAYGVIGGLLACLRPEGVVVVAALMTARAWMLRDLCPAGPLVARYALGSSFAAAMYVTQTGWYWTLTTTLPFTGGLARHALDSAHGPRLAGVPFNVDILVRWAAYAPLALLAMLGVRGLLRRSRSQPDSEQVDRGSRHLGWALLTVLGVCTLLFMTLFANAHLGRYTIFYWPLAIVAGWVGAAPTIRSIWRRGGVRRSLLIASGAALMTVYCVEAVVRARTLNPGHRLSDLALAPQQRQATTDALLARLRHSEAETQDRVAVVGIVEVQRRYWWDDRVQVASLDGVVDYRLAPFVRDGYWDHLGFAKAVGITHFMAFPNFNRDRSAFALRDLLGLKPGEVMLKDGVKMTKLPSGAVSVDLSFP